MTELGGTYNFGVLFQYDIATSTYTRKLSFDGPINGKNPYGSLMQASDGNLYGMSNLGGSINVGVLFQYDPALSNAIVKINFERSIGGDIPYASLILASDGKFYGMTEQGGVSGNGLGALFQYDPVS